MARSASCSMREPEREEGRLGGDDVIDGGDDVIGADGPWYGERRGDK